jgi:N-succinyl-L-ornithine transcarbamylase
VQAPHPSIFDIDKRLDNAFSRPFSYVYVKNWSAFNDYGKILCTDERWMLTEAHLKHAPEAKVMHCLPVRRNIELSDEILDGPRSLVQQQAFNRVFAAQAVISKLLE